MGLMVSRSPGVLFSSTQEMNFKLSEFYTSYSKLALDSSHRPLWNTGFTGLGWCFFNITPPPRKQMEFYSCR